MNQNDVQQFEKALKQMEEVHNLLPTQEALDRGLKEFQQLEEWKIGVAILIQDAEKAKKELDRYTQLLKNLISVR